MIRALVSLAAAVSLAACATVPPEAEAPPPTLVSYAWATFDRNGITASAASGPADRATGRALTINDPARIASISKLVLTLGVMRLVEQGQLDLDADVSEKLGWRLRNPAFPDAPITLRLLLSHRSSLTDAADYAVPFGETVAQRIANPKAFDPAHAPGTYFRYSNLNFPVVASVMEGATGERFDALMQRLVLRPLKLDACYNWSGCSDAAIDRAAVLYAPTGEEVLRDDLRGALPTCLVNTLPGAGCDLSTYRLASNGALFSPQGGLRISIADLAEIGRLLLREGRAADGSRFLTQASIAAMTTPEWRHDGSNGETEKGFYCAYGLAVQRLAACPPNDDPIGGAPEAFGHAGDAYGLKSGLWVDPATGKGIAYLATGIAEDAHGKRSAYWAIEEWLAAKLRR
ncbi:MAG TPA: serine hydrolase domain-containing protein [Allosphingosinicella sp.]|jgi:CubicO group peptidase (beta-lactamase class C family)